MTAISITATRITDIDAAIDRLKIAQTYCGDSTTNALLTDRIADLLIERGTLLARNVEKASKPVAKVAPVQTAPEKVAKPSKKAAKKAEKAAPVKLVVKAESKPAKVEDAKPTRKIADGRIMLAGKGTITAGQKKRLTAAGIDGRTLRYMSMADAAEKWAAIKG